MPNTYPQSGISVSQVSSKDGINLALTYDGLLYQSGADSVFVHYGYGSKWTNSDTVKMTRTENGFKVNLPLAKTGTVNVAFKDSAHNWDNNSGLNYSFTVRAK